MRVAQWQFQQVMMAILWTFNQLKQNVSSLYTGADKNVAESCSWQRTQETQKETQFIAAKEMKTLLIGVKKWAPLHV